MSRKTPEPCDQRYGNVAPATVGTIQRQLLVLENPGADKFFGEPALDINDLLLKDVDGRGFINILKAEKLIRSPYLYATFLLWLLSELFERLPEVGDLPQPKLVFFYDEAHLLFDNAPKALMSAVEQVVRLIRSKGVGVYFVTQNPLDVPDVVLGQLGNRAQHALRAFTPRDQKAVRAAADTFPAKSRLRHRRRHHQARRWRSACLHAGRRRGSGHGDARVDRPARLACRPDHRRRIAGGAGREGPVQGQIRHACGSAIGF